MLPVVVHFAQCVARRGVMVWFTLTNAVEMRGVAIDQQCSLKYSALYE